MRPLTSALRYAVRIALAPGRASESLLADPHRLRHGVLAWLVIGVVYGFVAFVGGLNGVGASVEPSLRVPADSYYLWMGPLTPAIYLLHFLVLSGLIQLGGRLSGGRGTFEDTFSVVSLTFFFPVFLTMWLVEAPCLVFVPEWCRGGSDGLTYLPGWLDIGRQALGVGWILVILAIAVGRVQRLGPVKAIGLTVPASILAWAVTLTYLR